VSVCSTESPFDRAWHDGRKGILSEVSASEATMSHLLRKLESAFFALVDFFLDA
jgi:hypothetical protein